MSPAVMWLSCLRMSAMSRSRLLLVAQPEHERHGAGGLAARFERAGDERLAGPLCGRREARRVIGFVQQLRGFAQNDEIARNTSPSPSAPSA